MSTAYAATRLRPDIARNDPSDRHRRHRRISGRKGSIRPNRHNRDPNMQIVCRFAERCDVKMPQQCKDSCAPLIPDGDDHDLDTSDK